MKTTMKKNYLLFAAAALTLAACSNDENLNDGPVELRLGSALEVETRATNVQNTQIVSGETVYAWVDESDGNPYINAWQLTADGNGCFTGSKQFFPQSGNAVNIYAIHGNFGTTTFTDFPTTPLTHTVSTTQTSDADVAKSDLLYAAYDEDAHPTQRPVTTVNMTFYHMLSKIDVGLKPGDGLTVTDLQNATVSIVNTVASATFTPQKTDLTEEATRAAMVSVNETTAASIAMSTAVSTDFSSRAEAIIVPQTLTSNTQFIQVTLNDGANLYYTLPQQVEFKSGMKYTYDITVHNTGLEVRSNIINWGTDDSYSGDNAGEATT